LWARLQQRHRERRVVPVRDVVEYPGEGPPRSTPPPLPPLGIVVLRRRPVAIVRGDPFVALPDEEGRPHDVDVGVPSRVVPLLLREI
jgi:hypothetical protein